MIIQHCFEPLELKILRSLNERMELPDKEKHRLFSLNKGYKGEKIFETDWLKNLSCECFIINDLLLEYSGNVFQIDTLLISQKTIYLFDVKYFEDDFYIIEGKWHRKSSEKEIKDPLLQLTRCESLFRRLLQDIHVNLPVEANLIFINPHFTLYHAALDLPIIFPGQIQRYMKNIETSPSKLNEMHSKLVDQLMTRQLDEAKYARYPSYKYELLKKGLTCGSCDSFMVLSTIRNKLICQKCGQIEVVDDAVIRNVKQFQLLFPERKITTNIIYEWCGVIESNKTIRRILMKNFNHIDHARLSYFVDR
ncbi:nuclease-related domain-containing protein [Bacillus benzoevorans]|uniref:NERD domain-containing protein n=1 Tax=Bacillus benzoevorans TaxID=1456 RepID=A0A7X0HQK5_9BACI|nr:nuclease-related domain-containing protein [Bacillus benzoevorans]MBB6444969.1 hypothetical protein [Bacillus benzoevorans]